MSNIINVKEERNILSFSGEVLKVVKNSTNFYLKFELDAEWELNTIVTAIFNFDGKNIYVELDENRMCQIPPTNSSRIWFCLTAEPDEVSKLSSTILSLDVEESGETDLSNVEEYRNTHSNMMGVVQNLLSGNVSAKNADFANVAGVSLTQVSLTGDEEVAGEKNFTGTIKHNSNRVPDCYEISNPNLIFNANFVVNQRGEFYYARNGEDIYTADRWGIFKGNGKFDVRTHILEGLDETSPTVFGQWIENAHLLKGKYITVGATINGERYVKTILMPETFVYGEDYIDNIYECDDFVFRIYYFVDSTEEFSVLGVQFIVENGKSITIYDVKVEESSFETKFIERPIAEDLALCQRYFQRVNTWSVGYGLTTEKLVFFAPTPTTMRIVGKIAINTAPYVIENGSRTQMKGTIKFNNLTHNGVQFIYMPTEVSLVKYQHYHICTGNIAIDGEYYK